MASRKINLINTIKPKNNMRYKFYKISLFEMTLGAMAEVNINEHSVYYKINFRIVDE